MMTGGISTKAMSQTLINGGDITSRGGDDDHSQHNLHKKSSIFESWAQGLGQTLENLFKPASHTLNQPQ